MQRTETAPPRGLRRRTPRGRPRIGPDERTGRVLVRWQRFLNVNPLAAGADELAAFAYWFIYLSGLSIDPEFHRNRLADLRLDNAGDAQMLALVGEVERGRVDLSFCRGTGQPFFGGAALLPSALPKSFRTGELLRVTISRPRCRKCGCTNEHGCPGGCYWVLADLCSTCAPARRGKENGASHEER